MWFCSLFALPYEMDLIKSGLSSGHFFCKFYILSIQFKWYYSIFSIKISAELVPSFGELFWLFDNFFNSFLGLWLFNISSICAQDVFDPVKYKVRFLFCDCFSLLFIDTSLSVLQCFLSYHSNRNVILNNFCQNTL